MSIADVLKSTTTKTTETTTAVATTAFGKDNVNIMCRNTC